MLSSTAFLPDARHKYAQLHAEKAAEQQPYFEKATSEISQMILVVTDCSEFPIRITNEMSLLQVIEQAGTINVKEWLEARHYIVGFSIYSAVFDDGKGKLDEFVINLPDIR